MKRSRILPLAVFGFALAIRAWVAVDAQDAPFWSSPMVDEIAYMQMSERIVLGQDPPEGAWYMTPGYAWFLAALVKMGAQLPQVKLIQLLLGAVNAWLIFLLGRRWFDARVGVIAGLAWSVAPTVLMHELLILKPTLSVLLALLALLAVSRERSGWLAWLLGGLALGAAALVRGEMLIVGIALVAVSMIASRRSWPMAPRSWSAPLFGALMIVAVVAIPTAQNLARGGGFVVIAYSGGPNFYIGNHAGADGSYLPLRPDRSDATVEERDAVALARSQSSRALDAAGVSRFWMNRGWAWWAQSPGAAIALTAKKALLLWSGWEGNDVLSVPMAGRWVGALRNPIVRPWLIFPLGLVGLMFVRPWSRHWPLLAFVVASWAALVPFFVFERFRLPLSAGAVLLASAVLVRAVDRWRAGAVKPVFAAGLATVALVGLLALPKVQRDEMVLHVNIGSMLLEQGRWEEALEEFDIVRRATPGARRVEINRATALHRLGRGDEALRALDRAIEFLYAEARGTGRPAVEELAYSHELAGDILRERGQRDGAIRHYRAVLDLAPGHRRVAARLRAIERD